MKRLILLMLLVAAGPVLAQPPQEVTTDETIQLRVQQTRTFRFGYSVNRITLSAKDVAEVTPESDRLVNLRGVAQGQTLMIAYGSDGNEVYRANIAVLQAGGFVKIYGVKGAGLDYVSYYCDDNGCGRANQDKVPEPFSTTFSETKPRPDGSSSTISREYR